VIRTDVIDRLERSPRLLRLPRAARAALRFRKETGTSVRDLLHEGAAMRRNQDLTLSQLAMAANAPMLIKATMVDGKPEVGILPTGQVTGVIDELPTVAELLARIESDAESTLKRLT
jgi:NAD(P)H-dependent flavin oxidoreductase YrpB (nitropropane dioxygenase family)